MRGLFLVYVGGRGSSGYLLSKRPRGGVLLGGDGVKGWGGRIMLTEESGGEGRKKGNEEGYKVNLLRRIWLWGSEGRIDAS